MTYLSFADVFVVNFRSRHRVHIFRHSRLNRLGFRWRPVELLTSLGRCLVQQVSLDNLRTFLFLISTAHILMLEGTRCGTYIACLNLMWHLLRQIHLLGYVHRNFRSLLLRSNCHHLLNTFLKCVVIDEEFSLGATALSFRKGKLKGVKGQPHALPHFDEHLLEFSVMFHAVLELLLENLGVEQCLCTSKRQHFNQSRFVAVPGLVVDHGKNLLWQQMLQKVVTV
mmetsp:Transcript_93751/g.185924  ORF Transcript_93751/g.185924 Transcript_93751/m.185924 type:complete len:225 (+) Transcript_93751:931-1605(+)